MKKIIKNLYMLILHPILFFRFTIKSKSKNFCVKQRSNIKNVNCLEVGMNVNIGTDVRINFFDQSNKNHLFIGDNVYICNRNSFIVGGNISIGGNTIIASDVAIISENHGINPNEIIPYKDQKIKCEEVSIGEGSWIGEKVIILPGVSIGKKVIVGAGSVVTKSIPDYSIVVGNPAIIIKQYDFNKKEWVKYHG